MTHFTGGTPYYITSSTSCVSEKVTQCDHVNIPLQIQSFNKRTIIFCVGSILPRHGIDSQKYKTYRFPRIRDRKYETKNMEAIKCEVVWSWVGKRAFLQNDLIPPTPILLP